MSHYAWVGHVSGVKTAINLINFSSIPKEMSAPLREMCVELPSNVSEFETICIIQSELDDSI